MARMRVNANGRWEIYGGIDRLKVGEVIHVEVEGHDGLEPTRIEFEQAACGGRYVSMDGYPLWDGMRAER